MSKKDGRGSLADQKTLPERTFQDRFQDKGNEQRRHGKTVFPQQITENTE